MIEVIPSWIVTAELNDGPITLRCSREDLDAVIRCVQHSNARWFRAEREPDDWQQWPRLGNDAKLHGDLQHGINCSGQIAGREEDCTCGLRYRIALRTEQEMHAAWRKRAEEAEQHKAEVAELRERYRSMLEKGTVELKDRRELVERLQAELERTQTALGQANADLMGCRDGALVRDLRAENARLRTELENQSRLLGLVIAERDAAKERSNIASAERQHAQQPPRRE